jgi:hypothetical protein
MLCDDLGVLDLDQSSADGQITADDSASATATQHLRLDRHAPQLSARIVTGVTSSSVREVRLIGCGLVAAELARLVETASITSIDASFNPELAAEGSLQTTDGMQPLRRALYGRRLHQPLQKLRLARCGLDDKTLTYLAPALRASGVAQLDLSCNTLSHLEGLSAWAAHLDEPGAAAVTLQELHLSGNPLTLIGARAVASTVHQIASLDSIAVGGTPFSHYTNAKLLEAMLRPASSSTPQLSNISIIACTLDRFAIASLVGVCRPGARLRLHNCVLDRSAVAELCRRVKDMQLSGLALSSNGPESAAIDALGALGAGVSRLESLELRNETADWSSALDSSTFEQLHRLEVHRSGFLQPAADHHRRPTAEGQDGSLHEHPAACAESCGSCMPSNSADWGVMWDERVSHSKRLLASLGQQGHALDRAAAWHSSWQHKEDQPWHIWANSQLVPKVQQSRHQTSAAGPAPAAHPDPAWLLLCRPPKLESLVLWDCGLALPSVVRVMGSMEARLRLGHSAIRELRLGGNDFTAGQCALITGWLRFGAGVPLLTRLDLNACSLPDASMFAMLQALIERRVAAPSSALSLQHLDVGCNEAGDMSFHCLALLLACPARAGPVAPLRTLRAHANSAVGAAGLTSLTAAVMTNSVLDACRAWTSGTSRRNPALHQAFLASVRANKALAGLRHAVASWALAGAQ